MSQLAYEYVGEKVNDQFSGYGQITFLQETTYEGQTYQKGDNYRGEFENSQFHGLGTLIYADGTSYKGEFANQIPHGFGVWKYVEGAIYSGQFNMGLREGIGTLIYTGDIYTGEWFNGRRHGVGSQHYSYGDNFYGHWCHGKPHQLQCGCKNYQSVCTCGCIRCICKSRREYISDCEKKYQGYEDDWTSGQPKLNDYN